MEAEPAWEPDALAALSDEALVQLVQAGNPGSAEAFGLLLERITPVINARVNHLSGHKAGENREDLVQEGVMGFLSAVSAYQSARGASFRTFASVCAGNRIVSALRRGGKAVQVVPLVESDLPAAAAAEDPQELFFAMEETRRMAEVIQNQLTELERGVMGAFLAGERYEAIAQRMGIRTKAVDNALQRVRKKLQQLRE
ncbi:MAG: sigma-70 family RNA polymerase sigma factor [Oscillospiraceae bacterium]|jgi:RNA polymerase sporulation-specific sigma factor|nr:sigma-70 family RNA polymerase sigma factor [Oscillospiraceae bacterium]